MKLNDLKKCIREAIDEEIDEMDVYHGTGSNFDKFDHRRHLGSGYGSQCFGWGSYFTNDRPVANSYAIQSANTYQKNGKTVKDIKSSIFGDVNKYTDDIQYLISKLDYENVDVKSLHKIFLDNLKFLYELDKLLVDNYSRQYNFKTLLSYLIRFCNLFPSTALNIGTPYNKIYYNVSNKTFYDNNTDPITELDERIINKFLKYVRKLEGEMNTATQILYHNGIMQNYTKDKNHYIYNVDIPDDNGNNYLSWYDELGMENAYKIYSAMYYISNNNHLKKYLKYFNYFIKYFNSNDANEIIKSISGMSTQIFYNLLTYIFENNQKPVSLILNKAGFIGIKYPTGTKWKRPEGSSDNGMNYVVFRGNNTNITSRETV